MLGLRLATNVLFNLMIALWVWHDALRRRAPKPLFAALLALMWGPLGIAFWAAERPLRPGERRTGGTPWVMGTTFALAWTALAPTIFVLVLPAVTEGAAVPGSDGRTIGILPATALVALGVWAGPTAFALGVARVRRTRHVQIGTTVTPASSIPLGAALAVAAVVAFVFALSQTLLR